VPAASSGTRVVSRLPRLLRMLGQKFKRQQTRNPPPYQPRASPQLHWHPRFGYTTTIMAATVGANPLLSSHQASDVQVVLHPLVLLTISDYITRHNLRGLPGPIVGGLLGLHRGREVTIEHAFDCATVPDADPANTSMIDSERFNHRLEQCAPSPRSPTANPYSRDILS
jgi:hypothetical protein